MSRSSRTRARAVALFAVAGLLIAACGDDDDSAADDGGATAEETAAPETTMAPESSSAESPATSVAESSSAESSAASDSAEPTATETTAPAGEEWTPVIRPAEQAWRIGYGDGRSDLPFTADVWKGVQEVAEEMGVELVYCDNAVSQEKTVECANLHVTEGVDGVIFANWLTGTEELIASTYQDAGIKCLTWSSPHPGCPNFGPNEFESSRLAGKLLGEYAIAQGWDPAAIQFIAPTAYGCAVCVTRTEGAIAGLTETIDIPEENIDDTIAIETGPDEFIPKVTDWATAHPDAEYVLCFGESDPSAVNCGLALEQSGFLGRAASVGIGASVEAITEMRGRTAEESVYLGTIAFFPENYGQYLIPAMVDMLEGKTLPNELYSVSAPITRDNIDEYYPE